METIKIKYHADIQPITQTDMSDWIDLRSGETVELKAGQSRVISLGVSMELPKEYEAHIIPRSSTYKNFGIIQSNHFSLIDNSYNSDDDIWHYPVIALRDTVIHKGDRICQFRIAKRQPIIAFEPVKSLGNKERGGFGSTGVK